MVEMRKLPSAAGSLDLEDFACLAGLTLPGP